MERIYLDHAASTPVDPRVFAAMRPYFEKEYGNPGSLHSFGQAALSAVDSARERVANALGVDFREIIFTGSATEANNLALRGAVKRYSETRIWNLESRGNAGKETARFQIPDSSFSSRPRVIVSSIEHESILETAKDLEKEGVDVVYLPVDRKGMVDIGALREALTPETAIVSIMHGNNETGVVQPIGKIGKIIQEFRISNLETSGNTGKEIASTRFQVPDSRFYPLFHTDAAQTFQYLDCAPDKFQADLMTISAHKMGGPKGAGALYVRDLGSGIWNLESRKTPRDPRFQVLREVPRGKLPDSRFQILDSIQTGGGQEFGLRSATENVPLIVGLAKAVELAVAERDKRFKHVLKLRTQFIKGLKKLDSRFQILDSSSHLPHILNFSIPGSSAGVMLMTLDLQGLAIASGSACRSRSQEPSHVLKAMGLPESRIRGSLRVSFGPGTRASEVQKALKTLKYVLRSAKVH